VYEPRYIISHTILRNIGSIEASREVIEHAALVPSYEAQFREEALVRTVHHGTRLEGNELSLEQAERVIQMGEAYAEPAAAKAGIVGRDRDVQEVINYRRVVDWIDELGTQESVGIQIDATLLKDLHGIISYRILPVEQRGTYRNVPVVVKNSQTGEVTFKPPPPVEIPVLVDDFFEWFHSESGRQHHPILRAGIAHYELVRIHPFIDANGRTARAIALLALHTDDYDVKRFFSLERYFDGNAAEYYKALQSVGEEEAYDLTYWLEYFTHGLGVELNKVKQKVLKLSADHTLKTKMGKQVALSQRQITILDTIQEQNGRVYSSDLESVLPMVSIDTILRDLKDLIKKGLIRKRGRTKGAYYELAN
jgi:Fic family protein